MTDRMALTIDGLAVEADAGETILAVARRLGLEVPVLCYSPHTTPNGLCRLCVVEVEGMRGLAAACVTEARPGMVVHTRSEKVLRARRTLLEMLAYTVDLSEAPDLLRLLDSLEADPGRFEGGQPRRPELIEDNPMYIRDYAKCVLCWRCVQVCAEDAQYAFALDFSGRGYHTSIGTFAELPMPRTSCVFCGQCLGVCPTGALKGVREHRLATGRPLDDPAGQAAVRPQKRKRSGAQGA